MKTTITHRDATLTAEELTAEILTAYELGPAGPGFCTAPYVGFATCNRIGDHDGEHVTVSLTNRMIAF